MDKLKKVLAAMLLCVSMVMIAGAGTAKAEETKVIPAGTYAFKEQLGNWELISHYDYWYLGYCTMYKYRSDYTGYHYHICPNEPYLAIHRDNIIVTTGHAECSNATIEYFGNSYGWETATGLNYGKGENVTRHFILEQDTEVETSFYNWFVLNVEDVDGLLVDHYDFTEWCADAGLNCAASSNESTSVIPFWFNEKYIYIVRKCITPSQTSGTWLMSMIYYSADSVHYPYHREVGDVGYIGLASASETTQTITVRNFVYDEAGNGWLLREKTDCEINSTAPVTTISNSEMLGNNVVMIYSSCDIYTDANKSSIWFHESGSFCDAEIKLPEITTAPIGGSSGSGSSSSGSSGTGGGALAFIISIMSMIWTDICGIPMNIDGYIITLQQIIVYAIIATILGGLFIKMIFGKKG